MLVKQITFYWAKEIYNFYHKTHLAPQGHKRSYVLLEDLRGCEFTSHPLMPFLLSDIESAESGIMKERLDDLLSDNNEDFFVRLNDDGDHYIYSNKFRVLGICSIGRTVARFKDPNFYEITRICFLPDFDPKAEKKYSYPSKFIMKATDMFKDDFPDAKIVTYIHENQSGKYLEHAGFNFDKLITYKPNQKGWGSRSKKKSDLKSKKRFIL